MAEKPTKKAPELPEAVRAACLEVGAEPASLLEFKLYPDRVVIVLFDYRKHTFTLADLAARIGIRG